jgi:hypothetical protein
LRQSLPAELIGLRSSLHVVIDPPGKDGVERRIFFVPGETMTPYESIETFAVSTSSSTRKTSRADPPDRPQGLG